MTECGCRWWDQDGGGHLVWDECDEAVRLTGLQNGLDDFVDHITAALQRLERARPAIAFVAALEDANAELRQKVDELRTMVKDAGSGAPSEEEITAWADEWAAANGADQWTWRQAVKDAVRWARRGAAVAWPSEAEINVAARERFPFPVGGSADHIGRQTELRARWTDGAHWHRDEIQQRIGAALPAPEPPAVEWPTAAEVDDEALAQTRPFEHDNKHDLQLVRRSWFAAGARWLRERLEASQRPAPAVDPFEVWWEANQYEVLKGSAPWPSEVKRAARLAWKAAKES